MNFSSGLTHASQKPCELISVKPDDSTTGCPPAIKGMINVDVIHDGQWIPRAYSVTDRIDPETLNQAFIKERDWGAELVAKSLASALHIPNYFRVNTARVLLDFGRFPGVSPTAASHMERRAINAPFSTLLDHDQKHALLLEHYDEISRQLEDALITTKLKIGIHTYDKRNPSATRRPEVSIITRPFGHQHLEANPTPAFDPLCPFDIVECTADRLLRARLGLELERAGLHAADNFPYTLPEGSVELRAQVWFYFQHIRQAYTRSERIKGLGISNDAQDLVWDMLLDTNRRSAQSDALRSFLHAFRTPPRERAKLYFEARRLYQDLRVFVAQNKERLLSEFDFDQGRPSTILVEVRKDLVWHFENGMPVAPNAENAQRIGRTLANAMIKYLNRDVVERDSVLTR